jgi:hypothetical protein
MTTRTTIYLDPKLHRALKLKAIQTSVSVSELIGDAIRQSLKEDAIDLQKIDGRISETAVSYESVLKELKKDGLV